MLSISGDSGRRGTLLNNSLSNKRVWGDVLSLGIDDQSRFRQVFRLSKSFAIQFGKCALLISSNYASTMTFRSSGRLFGPRDRRVSLFCGGRALIEVEDKSFRSERRFCCELVVTKLKSHYQNKNICVTLGRGVNHVKTFSFFLPRDDIM